LLKPPESKWIYYRIPFCLWVWWKHLALNGSQAIPGLKKKPNVPSVKMFSTDLKAKLILRRASSVKLVCKGNAYCLACSTSRLSMTSYFVKADLRGEPIQVATWNSNIFVSVLSSTAPPILAFHPSTPVTGLTPPCLTNTNDIIALEADQHFHFILFVSHTACVGVQSFHAHLRDLRAPSSSSNVPTRTATLWWCHANPWLIYCSPVGIPFPHWF